MSSGLALVLGVVLPLTIPMPSRADEPPSPAELWRAYPLAPDNHDADLGGATPGHVSRPVGTGRSGVVYHDGNGGGTPADSRLILQLGMLLAILYFAFLCVWFWTTRHVSAVGGQDIAHSLRRVRRSWGAATLADWHPVPRVRFAASRARVTLASGRSPWTCEIRWHPGHLRSRFQAVTAPAGGGARRVMAQSTGVRWPPKDVRKPPTHELEAALGTLVAAILAAGWEPVSSAGSWSERRFVWRDEREPPTRLKPRRSRPSPDPARSPCGGGASGPSPAKPARRVVLRSSLGVAASTPVRP